MENQNIEWKEIWNLVDNNIVQRMGDSRSSNYIFP